MDSAISAMAMKKERLRRLPAARHESRSGSAAVVEMPRMLEGGIGVIDPARPESVNFAPSRQPRQQAVAHGAIVGEIDLLGIGEAALRGAGVTPRCASPAISVQRA